ncbi:GLIPR1-like protein 1 isoform X6 [Lissotriton helveticus]
MFWHLWSLYTDNPARVNMMRSPLLWTNIVGTPIRASEAQSIRIVVWAASYKLGCAAKKCSSLRNAVLFVCDYGPAGNYRGAKPYETGATCSKCAAGDHCVNNLCTNPERDQIIGYGSWSPISAECTQNCHIVLGFHLVCVVLTFVVDIVLQKV